MSLCRFAADCNVYVYESQDDLLRCCGCWLDGDFSCATDSEMVDHLLKHREAGHLVPDNVIAGLRGEECGPWPHASVRELMQEMRDASAGDDNDDGESEVR